MSGKRHAGSASKEEHPGLLGWWRNRAAVRTACTEGRHLAREAQRILKRKSYRIPTGVATEIQGDIDAVTEALAGEDLERLRKAIGVLDDAMDKHLAFARKSTIREYSESIGVAVAVALLLRAFVVEAFQIPSGSMIPTLKIGDHIFVSKFSYGLSIPFTDTKVFQYAEPKRGDVIVFKYPEDHSTDYIKRVIGLPGDVIEMRQEELYINGKPVPRQRVSQGCNESEASHAGGLPDEHDCELWNETIGGVTHQTLEEPGRGIRADFPRTVVPPNHLFMMGDNRDNSSDSRVWGFVDLSLVKGRALVVWWSRAETEGWSPVAWFKAVRWHRFFHPVR